MAVGFWSTLSTLIMNALLDDSWKFTRIVDYVFLINLLWNQNKIVSKNYKKYA